MSVWRGRLVRWLAAGLVLAGLTGVAAAWLPERFRLLGFVGAGIGLLAGWLLSLCTEPLRFHYRRSACVAGFGIGVVAWLATTGLWWRAHIAWVDAHEPGPSRAAAMLGARDLSMGDTGAEQKILRDIWAEALAQREDLKQLTAYLTRRVGGINAGPVAGWVVWSIELALAGVLSAWISTRSAGGPFCEECQNWLRVIRQQRFYAPLPDGVRAVVSDSGVKETGVRLLACQCEATTPRVELDVAVADGSSKTRILTETSDGEVQGLLQAIDAAQNLT